MRKETAKNSVLTPLEQMRQQYQKRKSDHGAREKDTLERLSRFSQAMKKTKAAATAGEPEPETEHYHGQVTEEDVLAGVASDDWMLTKFQCKSHIDDRLRAGDGRREEDYLVLDAREERLKR